MAITQQEFLQNFILAQASTNLAGVVDLLLMDKDAQTAIFRKAAHEQRDAINTTLATWDEDKAVERAALETQAADLDALF